MNPDNITPYLNRMGDRLQRENPNFPHLNPHAFRHAVASILVANGTDIVTTAAFYQFTVVMPNLNYGVPQDDLDAKILALIQKNNKISTEKLGMALGVSYKTIRRHIKAMGNVHYISRGFSGHWKVDEK